MYRTDRRMCARTRCVCSPVYTADNNMDDGGVVCACSLETVIVKCPTRSREPCQCRRSQQRAFCRGRASSRRDATVSINVSADRWEEIARCIM
jgi:hypothetical protein